MQILNIFTILSPNFFWQFFSWNQSCQQLKSPKPQHFHEFFTPKKSIIFSGNQSWIFEQKSPYFSAKIQISVSSKTIFEQKLDFCHNVYRRWLLEIIILMDFTVSFLRQFPYIFFRVFDHLKTILKIRFRKTALHTFVERRQNKLWWQMKLYYTN